MRKYRGYYIDGVVFKNTEEIDTYVKNSIIVKAKMFNSMLISGNYDSNQMLKISDEISLREKRLHDEFHMDYDSIEAAIYA